MGSDIFRNAPELNATQADELPEDVVKPEIIAIEKRNLNLKKSSEIETEDSVYKAIVKNSFSKQAASNNKILSEIMRTGVISNPDYIKTHAEKSLILKSLNTGKGEN